MVSCDRYPKFSLLPLLPMLQSRVSSSYTAGTSSYYAENVLYQHKAENARMGNYHTRDKTCPLSGMLEATQYNILIYLLLYFIVIYNIILYIDIIGTWIIRRSWGNC